MHARDCALRYVVSSISEHAHVMSLVDTLHGAP
jgi:hypothetical protein